MVPAEPGPRGSHRREGSTRYGASSVAEWVGGVCVALLACWLFFVVRPDVVDELQRRWGDHPRLLMVFGWAPMGLTFTAGCLIALRSEWLRRHGRTLPGLEAWAYAVLGLLVVPFALMLSGWRGKSRLGDPQAVLDDVSATSPWIATGISFGDEALAIFTAAAIVFAISRVLRVIPRPGWSIQVTLASWCAVAVLGSLGHLLIWSS